MKLPLWRFAIYTRVIPIGLAIDLPTVLPRNLLEALPTDHVPFGLDLRASASLTLRAHEATIRTGVTSDLAVARAEAAPALIAHRNRAAQDAAPKRRNGASPHDR